MLSIESPRTSTRKEFDDFLTQMIDNNLLQVFSVSATDAGIGRSKEDVPNRVEFIAGLHDLLGVGASSLEPLLLKLLCTSLKTNYGSESNVKFTVFCAAVEGAIGESNALLVKKEGD